MGIGYYTQNAEYTVYVYTNWGHTNIYILRDFGNRT